jgi:hypothetical protein
MEGLATAARAGVTAFVAEFMDSTGARCHGPLSEVWATPFERVAPVRSIPSFRGQVNFTGLYYAATMDAHVGFESWLERDVAMTLDFDPEVVAFASQPFWLSWAEDGEEHRHSPDFFARLADGTAGYGAAYRPGADRVVCTSVTRASQPSPLVLRHGPDPW